jgi:hypothetical protein
LNAMNIKNQHAAHLSEDQIDDLLIGDLDALAAPAAAHLDACLHCQSRVAAAKAPIASFKAVSLSWSERRSATLPPVAQPAVAVSVWHRYARWASVATAILLVGIAVPMAKHSDTPSTSKPATESIANAAAAPTAAEPAAQPQQATLRTVSLPQQSPDEIIRDNQMLEAIDQELATSDRSPADTFGYATAGARSPIHGRQAPIQD